MTLDGRKALDKACEFHHDFPTCRKVCKLTKDFFDRDLTSDDCELVFDKWKGECQKRVNGEISHDGPTHEEIEEAAVQRAELQE